MIIPVLRYFECQWHFQHHRNTLKDILAEGDSFGTSVSISSDGTVVLVGAFEDNSSVGSAYIFRYNGSTWDLMETEMLGSLVAFNNAGTNIQATSVEAAIREVNNKIGFWDSEP